MRDFEENDLIDGRDESVFFQLETPWHHERAFRTLIGVGIGLCAGLAWHFSPLGPISYILLALMIVLGAVLGALAPWQASLSKLRVEPHELALIDTQGRVQIVEAVGVELIMLMRGIRLDGGEMAVYRQLIIKSPQFQWRIRSDAQTLREATEHVASICPQAACIVAEEAIALPRIVHGCDEHEYRIRISKQITGLLRERFVRLMIGAAATGVVGIGVLLLLIVAAMDSDEPERTVTGATVPIILTVGSLAAFWLATRVAILRRRISAVIMTGSNVPDRASDWILGDRIVMSLQRPTHRETDRRRAWKFTVLALMLFWIPILGWLLSCYAAYLAADKRGSISSGVVAWLAFILSTLATIYALETYL